LKDRIAALQQRNASPPQPGSDASGSTSTVTGRVAVPGAGSLRDRIANFEKKGAVPAPRGRFGESAPVTGDSHSKKRGELYGNRVPELAKPTGEAALLVRKRTVSTHTPRSLSVSKPLSPTLTGNSPPLPPLQPQLTGDWPGFLETRYPSNFDSMERRTVSDVLPRTTALGDVNVEGPLRETEVEENVMGQTDNEAQETSLADVAETYDNIVPAGPQESESSTTVYENEHHSSEDVKTVSDSFIPEEPSSTPISHASLEEKPLTNDLIEQPEATVSPSAIAQPLPAVDDVIPLQPEPSTDSMESSFVQTISIAAPPINTVLEETLANDVSPPSSAPLSLNTDMSNSSGTELHTPSDNLSFKTAESPVLAKDMDNSLDVEEDAVLVTEPPQIVFSALARTVLVSTPSPTLDVPVSVPVPVVKIESPVDRLSELPDSPQTAKPKPAHIISPPQSAIIPVPASSSPSENAMLERKSTQKSFHAVVHHKVVETSTVETAPAVPVIRAIPKKANPSYPRQKVAAQRVVSQAYVEPESPSISDLASLVADAAMLEEVLSTPAKKLPRATTRPQPSLPQVRESKSLERQRPAEISVEGAHSASTPPSENSPFSDHKTAANSTSFFTSNLRANSQPDRTSTSPSRHSQSSKYLSGLRVRKTSMPGAYPRTSVCSEASAEDSAAVLTPSPPSTQGHDGSDTSSIRSSSKSWKSSKKGLGRASSWLFRKSRSPNSSDK
jgi:hypothetical protein